MNHDAMLWAILPSAIPAVVRLLTGQAPIERTPVLQMPPARGRIAVVPIHGVLTGPKYAAIASAAERAAADPDIGRIILSVDSPGGEVSGLPEAADVLARLAKIKPVSAIVEDISASAAYWLTSQAHDVTLTPSGEVGSVGVKVLHIDASKMLEDQGLKITELHSGDFKTDFSPYKPLSEGAKADMQARLAATHKDFVDAVSRGRGSRASAAMVKSRFGEGRMFPSSEAAKHGLVDTVQSAQDFYRALASPRIPISGVSQRRARLELERLKV
jgi:signal peptide peptidase SppA